MTLQEIGGLTGGVHLKTKIEIFMGKQFNKKTSENNKSLTIKKRDSKRSDD